MLETSRVERNLRYAVVINVSFETYTCVKKRKKKIGVDRANAVSGCGGI